MNKKIGMDSICCMLTTKIIAGQLLYCDLVESTMDTIRELADSKAKEGTVVVAGSQKKGRGRFGRSWFSETDKDILISILLKAVFGYITREDVSKGEIPIIGILKLEVS